MFSATLGIPVITLFRICGRRWLFTGIYRWALDIRSLMINFLRFCHWAKDGITRLNDSDKLPNDQDINN